MNNLKTKKLTSIALLIALEVILGRMGIMTPIVSINFSFVPLVINAILFGPISAAVSSGLADIIGSLMLPQGLGTYFPGYTVSAMLTGLVYGLILYRKPKNLGRIILACSITSLVISLGLSAFWVYVMTGKGYLAILFTRTLQIAVMIPVKVLVINMIVYRLIPLVKREAGNITSEKV